MNIALAVSDENLEQKILELEQTNEKLTHSQKDLAFKKPGDGIPPKDYKMIVGRKLNKTVKKNHKFKWEDFK